MCLSCGCGLPEADHNDPRHITRAVLDAAAKAAGISSKRAAANIVKTMKTTKRAADLLPSSEEPPAQ